MRALIKASVLAVTTLILTGCLGLFGPEAKVEAFLKSGDYQLLSDQTKADISAVEFTALYRPRLKQYLPADNPLSPIENALKSLVLMEFSAEPTDNGTKVLVKALYPKALDEMKWFSAGLETKLAFQPLLERLTVLYRFEMIQPGEVDFNESVQIFYLDDTGIVLDIDALRKSRKAEKRLAMIDAQITELTPEISMWRMRSENPKNYARFIELMQRDKHFAQQQARIDALNAEAKSLKPDYEHLALTSWQATRRNIKALRDLLAHAQATIELSQITLAAVDTNEINVEAWVSYKGALRFSADCRLRVYSAKGKLLHEEIVPQFLFNIAKYTERALQQRVKLSTIPQDATISLDIVAVYPEFLH